MKHMNYITDHFNYIESPRVRLLNEHYPPQSDDFRLTMCGVENCTSDKEIWDCARMGYHLHVILSGQGILEVGGVRQTLHGGQLFMIKPGERTRYHPAPQDPWNYCWIVFDGARAESYARQAGFGPGVNSLDCRIDTARFYRLCDRIMSVPQLNAAASMRRMGLALEFISLAVESASLNADHAARQHMPLYQKSEYVQHALDYIKNNFSSIAVADVSKYLGIDRSYFSAIFRQSQGITPNEYLLQVRMRQSSHMLLNLTMTIQDIGRFVGYEDSLTFSKAFKRFFGVSPKYYREMPPEARPDLERLIALRRARDEAPQALDHHEE